MALNDMQNRFVEEYLKTFHRTNAALAAGYSPKTAYAQGSRLLKNAEIADAISIRLKETAMEADEVLMRLAAIARGDIVDVLSVSGKDIVIDLPKAILAKKTGIIKRLTQKRKTFTTTSGTPVDEVQTTIELHDPLTALQLLGKNHKLFVDRTEVDGTIKFKDESEATGRIMGRLDKLAAKVGTDSGDKRDSTDEQGQTAT